MKSKLATNVVAALFAGMLLTSIGCMVTPGHGERIAKKTSPVQFTGFAANPDQPIRIYARDATNNTWVHLGTTYSSDEPFYYNGGQSYFWKKELKIPSKCWRKELGLIYCETMAQADGNALATFKPGFYNYYEDYDSMEELWNEQGAGNTAIVIADE